MENVIDFGLLKEYDSTLKEVLKVWQKQKSYSVNDTVQYKGNYLKCITAGTSGTTTLNFTGLDVGDTINDGTVVWEIVKPPSGGGVDLPEWKQNTSYTAGKYLVHEGTVYKVDTDFTSGTTFDDTNLTSYIAPIMEGATSSTNGNNGLVPTPTTSDISKFLCGDGTWKRAGSSELNVIDDTLWSGAFNSVVAGDTITLQNNYTDYDDILIYVNGQCMRSLSTSLGVTMGYDNDGGNLGATYSSHVIISFSGNSCNVIIWQYGTNMASGEFRLVGRKYTVTTGAYIDKSLLWSGTQSQITSGAVLNLTGNYTDYDLIEIRVSNDVVAKGYISFYTSDNNLAQIYFNESSATDRVVLGLNFTNSNATVIFSDFGSGYTNINMKIYGTKFLPNPNNYSTTEQEIGTWIDGKPLYRKVFENPTNGMSTGMTSSNFTFLNLWGWRAGGANRVPNKYSEIYIDPSTGVIYIDGVTNVSYAVLEYTKN